MENDGTQTSDEFSLGDLFELLWNARLLIAAVTLISLVAGGVTYLLVPRIYAANVAITPLSQAEFSKYLALSQEGRPLRSLQDNNQLNNQPNNQQNNQPRDGTFPYTPVTLLAGFSSYLRDYDRLAALVAQTGLIERGTLSEADYNRRVQQFITGLKFETPKAQDLAAGQHFLNLDAKARNQDKLGEFMRLALTEANRDFAKDLAAEVRMRAASLKNLTNAEAAKLQLEMRARRQRAEHERIDDATRKSEQSAIAHALGLQKPLDMRAIEMAEHGGTVSAQINSSGSQPMYLQGYAALDANIEILRNRKNDDPFIEDLREIQQDLYTAENNPRPAQILALLEQSPLANPETARLARFSLASITPEKTFPKLSIFGIGSLVAGLLLGFAIAFVRQKTRRAQVGKI